MPVPTGALWKMILRYLVLFLPSEEIREYGDHDPRADCVHVGFLAWDGGSKGTMLIQRARNILANENIVDIAVTMGISSK